MEVAFVHKGIYYFKDRETAILYGVQQGWNISRIIQYEFGVAIQKHISGPYYGPADEKKEGNQWK